MDLPLPGIVTGGGVLAHLNPDSVIVGCAVTDVAVICAFTRTVTIPDVPSNLAIFYYLDDVVRIHKIVSRRLSVDISEIVGVIFSLSGCSYKVDDNPLFCIAPSAMVD